MKAQASILDPLSIAVGGFILIIGMVIAITILISSQPLATQGLPTNSSAYKTIVTLTNGMTEGADSLVVGMVFILIAGMFISAYFLGGSIISLPVGIIFIIPEGLISFGLSDAAHNFLANPGLVAVTSQYFVMTQYLADNLPVIVVLSAIVYLALVVIRNRQTAFAAGPGGNIISG